MTFGRNLEENPGFWETFDNTVEKEVEDDTSVFEHMAEF